MRLVHGLVTLGIIAWALALPTGLLGGSTEAAPTKNSAQEKCDRGQFRILVDVGHTAEIPGAMSARGVPEYEFNLKLARAIERELSGAGFRSTLVLITGGATFAGLVSRVKRANEWPADLFLSIHHDSVPARFLEAGITRGSNANTVIAFAAIPYSSPTRTRKRLRACISLNSSVTN